MNTITFEQAIEKFRKQENIDDNLAIDFLSNFRFQIKKYLLNENLSDPEFVFAGLLHIITGDEDKDTTDFLIQLYNQYKEDSEKAYVIVDEMSVYCTGNSLSAPEFSDALTDALERYGEKSDYLEIILWAMAFCEIPGAKAHLLKYKDHKDSGVQHAIKKGLKFIAEKEGKS